MRGRYSWRRWGRQELAPLCEGQAWAAPPLTPPRALPPVCRDMAPGSCGLLVSLPAGAGPPAGGHHPARGSPGHRHGCQHHQKAVSPSMDPNPTWPLPHPSPAPASAVSWIIVHQDPAWVGVPDPAMPPPPPAPLGMASAGRCNSSIEARRSQAASCSKVRQGQWGGGPGLEVGG